MIYAGFNEGDQDTAGQGRESTGILYFSFVCTRRY
jgi:hypothetical protein